MSDQQPAGEVAICQVGPQDWQAVCEVTLKRLADSPQAYGDTLEEAQARSPQEWRLLGRLLAEPGRGCAFLARDESGICGFVRLYAALPHLPQGTALAAQLWVAPHRRGAGLGRKLMDAVGAWALEHSMGKMLLGVTEQNLPAMQFFAHLGYQDTGLRERSTDDTRGIILMERTLNG
jgi:GNAT superfamily N-acetyltransferase